MNLGRDMKVAKKMVLEVRKREDRKTNRVKKIRRKNLVPGIIYGPNTEPLMIMVEKPKLEAVLAHVSETTPITLKITDGDGTVEKTVFLKDLQRHKVNDSVIHVDFYEPMKGHTMHIHIPLHYVGKPKGVEKGGLKEIIHHEILVEALPDKIVEYIEVDISHLDVGDVLRVGDVKFPEGMDPLFDDDEVLVSILHKRAEEVVVEEVTEEVEEPEVVGKEEEQEEGEEEKE